MKPKKIAAGEFKNSCLRLMDEVQRDGIPIIVTKRGKPIVEVIPARERSVRGSLLGTIVHAAKDISSTGEKWDAER